MKKKKTNDEPNDSIFQAVLKLVKQNAELIDKTADKSEEDLSPEEAAGFQAMMSSVEGLVSPLVKQIERNVQEAQAKGGTVLHATSEELAAMPDEELYEELQDRTMGALGMDALGYLARLPEPIQAFAQVNLFLIAFDDGGIFGALTNDDVKLIAPELPAALTEIGAEPHREMLEAFFAENHIDSADLSAFAWKRRKTLVKQYDFDAFDDRFSEFPELRELLTVYARQHLELFTKI